MTKYSLSNFKLNNSLEYTRTRHLFLMFMSIVYTFAFASLYWQQPGLYSENGILPLRVQIGQQDNARPSFLVKLAKLHGASPYRTMEFILLASMCLSSMMILFQAIRTSFTFALLWIGYYTCFQVAGQFLYFQWDTLLLESGFLTILVAPVRIIYLKKRERQDFLYQDRITLWLIRWLAFRLLFASGIVKLTGGDKTWWGLTATSYHYQSQCIPTPLAYYAHWIPLWAHKLSTSLVYIFMAGTGILFFSPFRLHRLIAFWIQVSLQILIALTGNYNFFNLLTVILCLGLIDDRVLGYSPWKLVDENKSSSSLSCFWTFLRRLIHVTIFITYVHFTMRWFDIRWDPEKREISTQITFTRVQLDTFLRRFLPVCLFIAWCSLVLTIVHSVYVAFRRPEKIYGKIFHCLTTIAYSILALSLFFVSLVPFTTIERQTNKALPFELQSWYEKFDSYHLFNAYGLFRSMTGVDGRPELVIEGALTLKNPKWKEYEFYYKPGSVNRAPPFVAPHQPRLDWQMWFAALSHYQHEPWLAFLLYRLLTNQIEVLSLLQTNPFASIPPKQIRVSLYRYNFTEPPSINYWKRELINQEWFPTISLESSWFMSYIEQQNMTQTAQSYEKNLPLDLIRTVSNWMNGTIFTWFPVVIAMLFVFLRLLLCTKPKQAFAIRKVADCYQPVPSKDK